MQPPLRTLREVRPMVMLNTGWRSIPDRLLLCCEEEGVRPETEVMATEYSGGLSDSIPYHNIPAGKRKNAA